MATRYLYFVRHGQYDPDLPDTHKHYGALSKIGRQQAARTAKALRHLPVSNIYHSTLDRTTQTAEPFLQSFPQARVHRTRRLWECIPYAEGNLAAEFAHLPADVLEADAKHAQHAFNYYFRPTRGSHKYEILISHGNLIRYLVCRVLDIDPSKWLSLASANCGISCVAVHENGLCTLVSYNELAHLPPHLHTDNQYPVVELPPSITAPKAKRGATHQQPSQVSSPSLNGG